MFSAALLNALIVTGFILIIPIFNAGKRFSSTSGVELISEVSRY